MTEKYHVISPLIYLKIGLAISCSYNIQLTGSATDLETICCIHKFQVNIVRKKLRISIVEHNYFVHAYRGTLYRNAETQMKDR